MAKAPKVAVIDFETAGIEGRPKYPPVPVGFSLMEPGKKKSKYYAWGHPTGNNCSKEDAARVLKAVWTSNVQMLFHNAKFDVDVAETHMGCPPVPWDRIHDTLYLLFLADPHAMSLGLKPASERLLGLPPEERDAVKDWLVEQGIVRKTQKDWGAYICMAPGGLVGTYADGDVTRTKALFEKLYPEICERGMLDAYNRERRLMPILLRNEREGVKIDVKQLSADIPMFEKSMLDADNWLRKRLKVKDLNVDSDEEMADALENAGVVTEWVMTATGKRSTAKKNMTLDMFNDPKVAAVFGYRNRLATCLATFARPWHRVAAESGGLIYTNWNQVRQSSDGGYAGARTGRMSSNPNFQNIPKSFEDKGDGYTHPAHVKGLPPLPFMRRYFLPDDKKSWFCRRDFAQQELRILAHFEDGDLCSRYRADPTLDIHNIVRDGIRDMANLDLPRGAVKILNFGEIYGMGLGKLAAGMKVSVEVAQQIKRAKRASLPGIALLEKTLKERGKANQPMRTWGGREYFSEEPKWNGERWQTFEYKLLNYLIQGSAADCTKEAIIRYDEVRKDGRLLLTVHDEVDISCPKGALKQEMLILRDAMMSVEFDVPMLSDGEYGPNWSELTELKEPAPDLSRWKD